MKTKLLLLSLSIIGSIAFGQGTTAIRDATDGTRKMSVDASGRITEANSAAILAKLPALAARTPTITTVTTSGTVSAGARKLNFIFSADFTGSVLSATFAGSTDYSLPIEAPSGDTLAAVAYVVTTGSIRIVKVQ